MSNNFEVLVGNIGTVLRTPCPVEARAIYEAYVQQSCSAFGRAAGEDVTLFRNGEFEAGFSGLLSRVESP